MPWCRSALTWWSTEAGPARLGIAVCVAGNLCVFGVSAVYHVFRVPCRRLDHVTIFFLTPATYTPLALAADERSLPRAMLPVLWGRRSWRRA